jgi:hypothetical protein
MRERDNVRKATLRMTLSAVRNAEIAGDTPQELSDDDVIKVLIREAKRRREAAEAFRKGDREESAANEEAEAAVIAEYLPAELSDDELTVLIESAIAEVGATNMADMGKVMKAVQPKVQGRADGSRVAAAVKSRLAG